MWGASLLKPSQPLAAAPCRTAHHRAGDGPVSQGSWALVHAGPLTLIPKLVSGERRSRYSHRLFLSGRPLGNRSKGWFEENSSDNCLPVQDLSDGRSRGGEVSPAREALTQSLGLAKHHDTGGVQAATPARFALRRPPADDGLDRGQAVPEVHRGHPGATSVPCRQCPSAANASVGCIGVGGTARSVRSVPDAAATAVCEELSVVIAARAPALWTASPPRQIPRTGTCAWQLRPPRAGVGFEVW